MSNLESRIDDLYRRPLDEFVAARSALVAELKGADARRVRQLKKPTAVPWAVNQVYWHARAAFDGVLRSGAELRRAQIAALEGRSADIRPAVDVHRKAVASAVERAVQIAKAASIHPSPDAMARTFEALSLASKPAEPSGRLTHPLRPGGFEMLAGVEPVSRRVVPVKGDKNVSGPQAKQAEAIGRKREHAVAAAARRRVAAIAKLERAVDRAKAKVAESRRSWESAADELGAAERRLSALRESRPDQAPART